MTPPGSVAVDPVERRPLGRTGVRVSRLGIGGGSSFIRAGDDTDALIATAWDAGLRHFDTSPQYGGGRSEPLIGRALERYPREAYVLSTKAGREPDVDGHRVFDYSGRHVRASIERSLERLRTDRLDIVFLHDIDPDMHGEDFERRFDEATGPGYEALAAFKAAGTIGAIGVGLKDWDAALRLAKAMPLDCIMLAGGYTLLQHGSLDALLPWCVEHRVTVLVAAPFNTGILATGAVDGARYYYAPAPATIVERTRRIEAICARHGVALPAAALQFPLRHPAVASVVAGHEKPQEVERNLALMRAPIPDAMWEELAEETLIPADRALESSRGAGREDR